MLALANGFVLLRYAHSYIHVTYNKVVHRFLVYVAGALLLWLLWLVLAWRLLGMLPA